jgi:hypothetical protein
MEYVFDPLAYIHKLNKHELGYRHGEAGKAGRYFYISKKCLDFFPPLSDVVLNDHVLIDVIPPFSDDIVLTKFVYHNDKIADEGTRDEYRIYLNSAIDPTRDYFKEDDIVVMLKLYSTEVEPQELDMPRGKSFVYKILLYNSTDREYEKLAGMLEIASDLPSRSHTLIALSQLTFLDGLRRVKLGKKIIPTEVVEEALSEPVIHGAIVEAETTKVMRSRSFRDLILYFYNYKCAITGKSFVIEYNDYTNLEAAHICARAAGGGSHPSNGMALERNLHWAFDKGFFTLTADCKVEVHPKAMGFPFLKEKHGAGLQIPEDSRSKPNFESIKWHRDNVFGLFLKSKGNE